MPTCRSRTGSSSTLTPSKVRAPYGTMRCTKDLGQVLSNERMCSGPNSVAGSVLSSRLRRCRWWSRPASPSQRWPGTSGSMTYVGNWINPTGVRPELDQPTNSVKHARGQDRVVPPRHRAGLVCVSGMVVASSAPEEPCDLLEDQAGGVEGIRRNRLGIGLDLVGERAGDLPLLEGAVSLAVEQGGEPVDDVRGLLLVGVEAQVDIAICLLH